MPDSTNASKVFNANAQAYDTYRPKCPTQVVEHLQQWAQLGPQDRILEIGCGTGQLTQALASWNRPVLAVEKGADLAALARKNCVAFPQVQVVTKDFETWQSPHCFQLITACQSFHWIDKITGFTKVHSLLAPSGKVALIWHLDVSQDTLFWQRTAPVYRTFFPDRIDYVPLSQQVKEYQLYLQEGDLFTDFKRQYFLWEVSYSTLDYLGLLSTFSTQGSLPPTERRQFFQCIGQVIEELGDQVTRKQLTVMLLAQKKTRSDE